MMSGLFRIYTCSKSVLVNYASNNLLFGTLQEFFLVESLDCLFLFVDVFCYAHTRTNLVSLNLVWQFRFEKSKIL